MDKAELKKQIKIVAQQCFSAGFTSGADDFRTSKGGKLFQETKAYEKLEELLKYVDKYGD